MKCCSLVLLLFFSNVEFASAQKAAYKDTAFERLRERISRENRERESLFNISLEKSQRLLNDIKAKNEQGDMQPFMKELEAAQQKKQQQNSLRAVLAIAAFFLTVIVVAVIRSRRKKKFNV